MTLKEALDTGYRVQREDWLSLRNGNFFWYKKISENTYITHLGNKYHMHDYAFSIENTGNWVIHLEDQKLANFNLKLNKLLKD